ncbi:hypothetical protein FIBSPDRAFT_900295 [Athelia psychrophila]|uniref:Uncharacterized protein n=1 Tax=Athelia psychrophila TaxID=1759441 RepID=A0A165YLN3_9AGAM|nr:hypothetical protein FIBSPDRAFT_900295 [Fibularhizoctonia sp. CBS 109695]
MPDNLVSDMLGSASDNLGYDSPAACNNIGIAAGGNIRIAEGDNIGVAVGGNIGMAVGGNIGMAAGDDIGMAAGNYTGIAAYNNILNLVGLRDGRNDLGRYWSSWVSYGSLFSVEFKSGPRLPWKSLDHKILAIDQLCEKPLIGLYLWQQWADKVETQLMLQL